MTNLWLIYLTNHMDNLYDTFVFLFESDSSSAQYENTQNLHQIILVLKDMTDSYLFFYYTNTILQKHDTTSRANTIAALSTITSGCSRMTVPSVNTLKTEYYTLCLHTNKLLITQLSHRLSCRSEPAVKTSTCRATFNSIS